MPEAKKPIGGRTHGWRFAPLPPVSVSVMGLCQLWLDYSHLPPAIFSPVSLIRPPLALIPSLIAWLRRGWGCLGGCSVPYQHEAAGLQRLGAAIGRADSEPGHPDPNFNQTRQNPSACIFHRGNSRGETQETLLPASWEDAGPMEMQAATGWRGGTGGGGLQGWQGGGHGFALRAGNLEGKSCKEMWGEEPGAKGMGVSEKLLFFFSPLFLLVRF